MRAIVVYLQQIYTFEFVSVSAGHKTVEQARGLSVHFHAKFSCDGTSTWTQSTKNLEFSSSSYTHGMQCTYNEAFAGEPDEQCPVRRHVVWIITLTFLDNQIRLSMYFSIERKRILLG